MCTHLPCPKTPPGPPPQGPPFDLCVVCACLFVLGLPTNIVWCEVAGNNKKKVARVAQCSTTFI